MTSGYFPMGAMIANEKLYEPFRYGTTSFLHGFTFGGHPAGAAIALANLDIFEREGINEHVRSLEVKMIRLGILLQYFDCVGRCRFRRRWRSCTTSPSSATSEAPASFGASKW